MKISKNNNGLLDITQMDDSSTVSDLFAALDRYSSFHPLPCGKCPASCCDKRFFIEMDRVSALSLAGDKPLISYILSSLKITYPLDNSIQILLSDTTNTCQYLQNNGRCSIYESRPAACRLYSCERQSKKFMVINSVVVAALQNALIADYFEYIAEQKRYEIDNLLDEPIAWLRDTPAYKTESYRDIYIKDCIRFDMKGEDIKKEELQVYAALLAMKAA